jgi:hypothetical protein
VAGRAELDEKLDSCASRRPRETEVVVFEPRPAIALSAASRAAATNRLVLVSGL